jgi:4-hydroxybenzoate polyprenyltransferase
MMKVLLQLARVSNLPTIWTNCLVAVALARGGAWLGKLGSAAKTGGTEPNSLGLQAADWLQFGAAGLSISLLYTGGMFLNDAFDHKVDRVHAPTRPIPSGRISVPVVFALALLQLLIGWLGILILSSVRLGTPWSPATLAALGLALTIVLYDRYHKENPLSPLVMGLCRVGVYFSVGLLGLGTVSATPLEDGIGLPPGAILRLSLGSSLLLGYLMVLTFLAKREWRGGPPPVPIHVLIAGICLVDGLLLVAFGAAMWAPLAVFGFWATLRLQRFVRGT